MITIHQSINGDKDGAYALLGTSMKNIQEARRICNSTDMRARPGEGIEWSPALRGFAYDNYYLLLKTFKDVTPGVRLGRIFSHAFIIEKKELPFITDLNAILELLPKEANKVAQLQPLEVAANSKAHKIEILKYSRQAKAINALLNHSEYRNTIVWVGREGFTQLITQVWQSVGPHIRWKINFDVAFDPREIDTQRLNIICIPHSVLAQWNKAQFCIINTADQEELNSSAAFYLAGYSDKGNLVGKLLKDLEVEPENLFDYTYLQDIADGLEKIHANTSIQSVLPIAALLSKFCPQVLKGDSIKSKVLDKIITLIPTATNKEIIGLHNIDWVGFNDAVDKILPGLQAWLDKYLMSGKETSLIISKMTEAKVTWWCQEVEACLRRKLNKWQSSYAPFIWTCLQKQSSTAIVNYIPASPSIERDLVESIPTTIIEKSNINELINFSVKRDWLTLHGILLLRIHSPEEALKRQFQVDTNISHLTSLERMAQDIPVEKLITIALNNNDIRITKITGKRIAGNKKLLTGMQVNISAWRKIWLESMSYVKDPYEGIDDPKSVMFNLMDQLIKGEKIELALLHNLSQTQWTDLTNFPSRSQIWKLLPSSIKDVFLESTASNVVTQLNEQNVEVADIEKELKDAIGSPNVFSAILADTSMSTLRKMQLFTDLPELNEHLFIKLLLHSPLLPQEATTAGKLIRKRNWIQAAQAIANNIGLRHDLQPALWESKDLLSFFSKVGLYLNGDLRRQAFSKDEWWDEFSKICFELYPKGPMDRGIWVQAGGKEYEIFHYGTGKEIWLKTINGLRDHSYNKVTTEKLIRIMVSENQQNRKLETLLKLYFNL